MFGRERTLEVKPYGDIQIEEQRRGGMAQDVKVPRTQAVWVALAAMLVCLSAPVAVRALGAMIFWLAVFVVGAGTFVYALYVAARYDQALVRGFTLLILFTGSVFALVAGGVGLALWEISVLAFPKWPITNPFINFFLALPSIGSLVFLALMSLAFVQELAYRSPFLEKALFTLLTSDGPPWWYKRPPPQRDVPMMAPHVAPKAAELGEYVPPPEAELTRLELFLLHTQDCDSLSRDRLCLAPMQDGSRLGQQEWRNCVDYLERQKYVQADGRTTRWAAGASAEVALAGIR